MRRAALILLCGSLLAGAWPDPALAQARQGRPRQGQAARPADPEAEPATPVQREGQALPGVDASRQWRLERLGPDHWKLTGDVEIERDDIKLFADEMEVFTDTNQLTARGNVVFSAPTHRISSDRVEFDLKTKLGTFFNASGTATLGGAGDAEEGRRKDRDMFGTQEPDVFFYGETLNKIGERKYRINKGGFTTCVQPTPRWELTSGSVVLSLDHYALLTNPLLRVKGVPVLYLPVIYYPINKEDRATGFLIPTYGSSSYRGQTISNAFFWAISRSHDATFLHDWYSKTGQGFGTEYRFVTSNTSRGDARFYMLKERPTTYTDSTGTTSSVAGRKGFELRGNVNQDLPFRLKARGRFDYFSDIQIQQTYYQNIYDASRRQRYYGGTLTGAWGAYSISAAVDRSEMFWDTTNSTMTGAQPRVTVGRAERPIFKTLVYASVTGEYTSMQRETKSGDVVNDLGVKRLDVTPSLRVPFRKWQFLTVNSSVAWRYTWWDKSQGLAGRIKDTSIDRQYFDFQARIVGPVFNRIWNPNNGYADKIKHTVEPFLNVQRVTSFEEYPYIIQLDSADYVIGGSTRYNYGLNNRFYVKKRQGNRQGRAREILNISLRQTYYTDERASVVDGSYATGFQLNAPNKFSPVSLQVRATPVEGINATFRAEYDTRRDAFRTLGIQGSWNFRDWLSTSGNWNRQRYFNQITAAGDIRTNQYISNQTTLRFKQNRFGGDISFNYDVQQKYFLQKRLVGYYNAQCCGFAVEYQVYNFGGYSSSYLLPVRKDKRFNLSITLAGLGTFSNLFGSFGGNSQNSY